MKGSKFILLGLFILCGIGVEAHNGKTVLLKGIIKKDTVIIEFLLHDGFEVGRYFSVADLRDHPFTGDSVVYIAKYTHKDRLECANKGGVWCVFWKNKKKTEGIKLEVLEDAKTSYAEEKKKRFRYYKIAETDSTETIKEAYTGLSLFRVKGANKVNERLHELHQNFCLTYCACQSILSLTLKSEVYSINNNLISFCLHSSNSCITEEVYEESQFYTWECRTGNDVRLENLFYWGEGAIPMYQSKEWFDYRYTIFAKQLLHTMVVVEACLRSEQFWQFPSWYVEGNEIVFMPFSSFLTDCDLKSRVYVPLELLLK